MKNIFFIPVVFLFACNQPAVDLSIQSAKEIMQADRDMSTLASKEGFYPALLQYADTNVVKLDDGRLPVIGKQDFSQLVKTKKMFTNLSWEPMKGEASKSGDIGWTWGNWKFVQADTTLYGVYFTAWKKQTDGSWKFTLDGGNNTPAPAE